MIGAAQPDPAPQASAATQSQALPYGLHAGFLASARAFPHRPALEVAGQRLTYAQLQAHACRLAQTLHQAWPNGAARRVGVLGSRSLQMYTGLLGGLMAGCTVVPLNPAFPFSRTRQMMELAALGALVVDEGGLQCLPDLLPLDGVPLLVCLPSTPADPGFTRRWPQHRFVVAANTTAGAADVPQQRLVDETQAEVAGERLDDRSAAPARAPEQRPPFEPVSVAPDAFAYLFFTSGSTGEPKGVGVLHRNVLRFVDMSLERYRAGGINQDDRFSQFYDITFDSSMFDLYVCWAFGACVCCPSAQDWVNPNKFIEAQGLTVIDIVPSTGQSMNRSNGWRAGRFSQLKLCRFGGEALAADLAAALAAAAPQAWLDNVYGPTECTVDAAYYRWQAAVSPSDCVHGVVPIGTAGPQVGLKVVDAELREVPVGGEGELLISGPQVTPGYWQNPEKTAAAFITLPGTDTVHYRTGDLVRRPAAGKPMAYLGRLDFQIKIAGVRIELGEVEEALRQAAHTTEVVAVGWPLVTSGACGIVAFVVQPGLDLTALRAQLKTVLPAVMVPRDIHLLEALPLNVNGKVDRKALLQWLQQQAVGKA